MLGVEQELGAAANQLETALKCSSPDIAYLKDQLLAAIERLQIWSEQTDWQMIFREHTGSGETTS